jgi:hypothetical protein
MSGISLIILNWKRAGNVINNINHYMSYRLVDEIILFNNNPDFDLKDIGNDKITVIESSRNLGLFPRYAAAGLARNSCILHCDDDLFLPEATVNQLYRHWTNNKHICHGLEGRRVGHEYNTDNAIGEVQIVLTRCLMVSRFNCLSALLFSTYFEDMPGEPKGNGEDIILSYIAMHNSRQFNRTYKLGYSNYPDYIDKQDGTSDSIHRSFPFHVQHRTAVAKRCSKLLNIK